MNPALNFKTHRNPAYLRLITRNHLTQFTNTLLRGPVRCNCGAIAELGRDRCTECLDGACRARDEHSEFAGVDLREVR